MSQLTARGVDQFVQATDRTKPVEPAVLAPNTTTAPTPHDSAPEMTEGSSVPPAVETQPQVEALPTLHFTCPVQGKGWNASPAPTAEQSDARGYHLWYSTSPGAWNYWGLFRSGIESPGDLTGLQSGEEVDVRMDRMFHPDSDGAPTMLMFTAPDDAC
jgi:hypothetical protein